MSVTQVKQALGSFSVTLRPTVPREILDALRYFGHIAIIEGRVDPRAYGDGLLDAAKYVGVYRNRVNDVDNRSSNVEGSYVLHGVSMAAWLGDESGKGDLFEDAVELNAATFANSIRALLPPHGAVTEGALHAVAGTYTSRHQYQTPRQAIDYVAETFGAEWRVNNDASLDAGLAEDLYPSEPTATLAKHAHGRDPNVIGYQGKIDSAEDVEAWVSRVVLLAEGSGLSIATGEADIAVNPYKDLHGGAVRMTQVVSESATVPLLADDRAALALGENDTTRRSLRLATSDYVLDGDLVVGGYVYVYDPETGIYDVTNEITFRGQRINPAKYRCVEITWPVRTGMTVAYRDPNGVWWDLTDHVNMEDTADTAITVGELPRSLSGGGVEPVGTRPAVDTSVPAAPAFVTPFATQTYLDGRGFSRSRVLLAWTAPINTDGSTLLDGDHYEIRYRVDTDLIYPQTWASISSTSWDDLNTWDQPFTPATSQWQTAYAAWGETTYVLHELATGVGYDVQIRAVDTNTNAGAWSTEITFTTNADNIAPSTPAAPTVAGSRIALQISHSLGRASGGTFNLESDLDHLEIHVEYEPTFTPTDATLKGKARATAGMMVALVPTVTTVQVEETSTRYVRVIAVDISGNKSSPSAASAATALLIDDAHISDLTVTKVTAGTISADWLIGASIRTALTGSRVELNASGLQAFNGAGTQTVDIDAATGDVSIIGELASGVGSDRVIVNPAGSASPEIRFYPTTGTDYFRIHSQPRSGEPSEVELYLTASTNTEGTGRSRTALKSGQVTSGVYNPALSALVGGGLLLQGEGGGFTTVELGHYSGAFTPDGCVFRGNETFAQAGFRNGTSVDNYFTFNDGGTTTHFGRWPDFVDNGATAGLFTGSVSGTNGANTLTISYGTTSSSQRLPIVAVSDNQSTANIRAFQINGASTSSFTTDLNGNANGAWAVYFWNFRI